MTEAGDAPGAGRPTNLVDLLGELTLPPEPAPIPLLPQTWGWPVLALLLAVTLWAVIRQGIRKRRADAYRRAALAALDAAGRDPEEVAQILRRTALTAFPRTDVAGLFGQDWLDFLNRTCPEAGFRGDAGAALITGPYAGTAPLPEATVALARRWIAGHRGTGPA